MAGQDHEGAEGWGSDTPSSMALGKRPNIPKSQLACLENGAALPASRFHADN